ncbi:MAG: aminopeptidase P family protein [Bacteroidetes bacterium]|jgi:Xaa-Pro aminopeptidase|nr:aminopeptidase P family protein [Bacteroidota bacterium]MBK6820881.1 aminopeptidase P family protein [Bacteroidota bacterium]MBK7587688.1 aminopeptidase P family protein [Bacteroidota bacterium]MBK8329287.1 aminopeptidase P family protein [Bacteroidota bacterium]MBK9480465.1 aminopeptidase P family protein [Bacteroidota bacterium]
MKYSAIDPKLYSHNRERFVKKMKSNAIAIFHAHPTLPENGDAVYHDKPNSDVVWLSGIVQEKTMVILYPDNLDKKYREVLVILRPNETLEIWYGHKLTKEEASEISGIPTVIYLDQLDAMLQAWMHHAEHVYLDTNENDRLDTTLPRLDLMYVHQLMKRYPLHKYERAAILLKELRAIKTKNEVAVMQQAVDITHKALMRVCKFITPGVFEYEVEAEITHEFLRNRATRHAYGCIIASGDRARILHYVENNQECKSGELILMDFGAEYGNYCADLTRTIPVNGKFTKRQKEIYDACLAVHMHAKKMLKPGKTWLEITESAEIEMNKQLLNIGLLSKEDIKNETPDNRACRKYFYHGLGHHLGIDVHDIGTRNTPIKEGMVFTIEPGIYVEKEKIGIRIENNYWVTKTGCIDLFKEIPITTEAIEKAMKK